MALDKRLLEILCCPVTKQPVLPLSAQQLDRFQREHAKKALLRSDGTAVDIPIEAGLITRDGKTLYLVVDGIPVMLADQAIATAQLVDFHV